MMYAEWTKRSVLAMIAVAFYMATRSQISAEIHPIETVLVVAVLLAAISWLESQILMRYLEVRTINKTMGNTLIVLGFFISLFFAYLVHGGLERFTTAMEKEVGDVVLWIASFGLSAINISLKWAMLADPGANMKPEAEVINISDIEQGASGLREAANQFG